MSADLTVYALPLEIVSEKKMAWTTCLFRHKYIFY